VTVSSRRAPVQPVTRSTVAAQLIHYGPQIAPLADWLTAGGYSDASRELILAHAGELNAVPDPYHPCWRRYGDQPRAAEQLTRGIWRCRNADRTDQPLPLRTRAQAFHDAWMDSLI